MAMVLASLMNLDMYFCIISTLDFVPNVTFDVESSRSQYSLMKNSFMQTFLSMSFCSAR